MIDNVQLKSRFGRIIAVIIWALIAFVIVNVFLQPDPVQSLGLVAWLLCLASLLFGVYWHPRVEFTQDYVRVVNLVRDWRISYPAITNITTQYALTIQTTEGHKITVWSAPAPSRYGTLGVAKSETEHLPQSTYLNETIRPGDIVTSDSGSAAAILRRNWEIANRDIVEHGATVHDAPGRTDTSGAISLAYNWTWPAVCIGLLVVGLVLSATH